MVVAVGVCFSACFGQDEMRIGDLGEFNFRSLVFPGRYADQLWPGRGVDLTPEQFLLRNQLLQQLMDELPRFEGTPAQLSERYYDKISEILEPEQQILLGQLVAREYYRQEGGRRPEEFLHPDLYWTHADLRIAIGLRRAQLDELRQRLNRWRVNAPDGAKNQAEVNSIFEEWQSRLEQCLLPKQQQMYHNTTGKAFDFGTLLDGLVNFLSVGGEHVFLRRDRVMHEISGPIPPLTMLLSTEQRLDGVLSWHGTADLLLRPAVQNELRLQEEQVVELAKWREDLYRLRPIPTQLSIEFRERGVLFQGQGKGQVVEQTSSFSESKPSRESDPWNDEQAKTLERVLDIGQRERLRQIKNQAILRLGWEKVPLTYPDWPSYLDLSQSQQESWRKIHQEMEQRYRELEKTHADELQNHADNLRGLTELLDDTQKAKLSHIFGPFS
jgi:hypothetical protein